MPHDVLSSSFVMHLSHYLSSLSPFRYNEVCAYDFNRGEFSMSTGHFTQLVWSDSTEFGIGMAPGQQNGMPCVFVVGRFKPSGNYKGEYKKNVFKGTFDPSYCDKIRDKKLL